MPIKGLSEARRLPRLGKFRIGIKVPNKNKEGEHPQATDYFVIPEQLKQYFPEGEKITSLPVMIPVEDDEIWCNQYYKCYSSYRGLVCKGDGETCMRMVDKATGDKANRDTKEIAWAKMTCTGKECPDFKSEDCKEVMNLQFIMPDFPGLGVWQIDTSSINSIHNINNAAAMIRAVYKRISFIPLALTLEEAETITKEGTKKKIHVLNLRTSGTMKELMQIASQPVAELLLPCPADDEAPLDFEDCEAENQENIHQTVPTATPAQSVNEESSKTSKAPEAKSPEAAPKEKTLKKEPAKKITKESVENTPPLTDADFDHPEAGEQSAEQKSSLEEGSDAWILLWIVKLNISDEAVINLLTTRYKFDPNTIIKSPIGDNLPKLAKNQRADFTTILKNKAKERGVT